MNKFESVPGVKYPDLDTKIAAGPVDGSDLTVYGEIADHFEALAQLMATQRCFDGAAHAQKAAEAFRVVTGR